MVRRSARDPDAYRWVPYLGGSDYGAWGLEVLDVDSEESWYTLPLRRDGLIVPLRAATAANPQGSIWLDGSLIWVERCSSRVQLLALYEAPVKLQERNAVLQGRLDRTCGRSNWGGAAFLNEPHLRKLYDVGYLHPIR